MERYLKTYTGVIDGKSDSEDESICSVHSSGSPSQKKKKDESTMPTTKRIYTQKVRKSWFSDPRLSNWITQESENEIKCKYCHCILKARLSSLINHGKASKHKAAASPFSKSGQKTIAFQAVGSSYKTKEAELLEVLYVAVHTTTRAVDHLVHVQKNIFSDSKAAVGMKLGRTKCSAIIKSVLGPHFQHLLTEDIGESMFSLIIDESTDITIDKYLGVVIRYYSKSLRKIVNTFLHLYELEDATANGINTAILKILKDFNLKISNMVGLGTDNAKVMTGINNGVIAKLRQKNENIILVPCACHSIQLAVSSVSKILPNEIEYLVAETYNWFSKSTLRQNCYKNIYAAINNETQPLKLVRACDTRWLSIEPAVNRIEKQWLELKTHFEIAASVESCHQAKVLKGLYINKNLLYLKFLKPLLSDVQKVNKMFESNDADPTMLLSELHYLLKNLSYQIVLKDDNFDPLHSRLEDFFVPTSYYNYDFEEFLKSIKDEIDSDTESEIRLNCRNFIVQLVYQIRQRLPKNFSNLKKAEFFSVENSLKSNKCNLMDNFKEDMSCFKTDKITIIELQWQRLNSYKWANQKSTVEFWIDVLEYKNALNENPFKDLASFVMRFLLLPFSNAEVERVFSGMNLLKTKVRNRMGLRTMNSLLYIRCGLKRLNKCCRTFEISSELVRKYDGNIYNISPESETEEYTFDDVFNF